MATVDYKGAYRKMFPGVLSSNSLLSVYILHMLSSAEKMYGKEIADAIYTRLNGTWNPSHGLIYPMLRKMEKEGLVEGIWEGNTSKKTRRFYQITDMGRQALEIEVLNIRPAFDDSQEMIKILMRDLYKEEVQ